MKYLKQIKEDTRLGRPTSIVDHSDSGFPHFGVTKGLKQFLGQKKGSILNGGNVVANGVAALTPIGVSDDGCSTDEGGKKVCTLQKTHANQLFCRLTHSAFLLYSQRSTHSDLQLSLAQLGQLRRRGGGKLRRHRQRRCGGRLRRCVGGHFGRLLGRQLQRNRPPLVAAG
jgi:hypothetical protein